MKNITLNVDEKILAAVRRYAAERDSSVNALVREYLAAIAQREGPGGSGPQTLWSTRPAIEGRVGKRNWDRNGLHER